MVVGLNQLFGFFVNLCCFLENVEDFFAHFVINKKAIVNFRAISKKTENERAGMVQVVVRCSMRKSCWNTSCV